MAEGVLEVATEFATTRTDRPVLVVLAFSGGQAGVDPRNVLKKVRQSGMTMSAVTLMAGGVDAGGVGAMSDQSGREQILGGGPTQSGGRRIEVPSTGAFPRRSSRSPTTCWPSTRLPTPSPKASSSAVTRPRPRP